MISYSNEEKKEEKNFVVKPLILLPHRLYIYIYIQQSNFSTFYSNELKQFKRKLSVILIKKTKKSSLTTILIAMPHRLLFIQKSNFSTSYSNSLKKNSKARKL